MPALVRSRPGTGAIKEDGDTTLRPRSSKNERNLLLTWWPWIGLVYRCPAPTQEGVRHDRHAVPPPGAIGPDGVHGRPGDQQLRAEDRRGPKSRGRGRGPDR